MRMGKGLKFKTVRWNSEKQKLRNRKFEPRSKNLCGDTEKIIIMIESTTKK